MAVERRNLRRAGKFPKRWRTVTDVPRGAPRGSPAEDLSIGKLEMGAGVLFATPGNHRHAGYGGYAGQGLAPKAEGVDGLKVSNAGDLAGGEPLKSQLDLIPRDARAVVGDSYVFDAPSRYLDGDAVGAGVHRVLKQLLDHGSGALDDLSSGDLGGDV